MTLAILHGATAAAVAATATQPDQRAALLAPFTGAWVLKYMAGATEAQRVTHAAAVTDSLTPRGFNLGAATANNVLVSGATVTSLIFSNGTDDIFSLDAADLDPTPAGPIVTQTGRWLNAADALGKLLVTALASLPVAAAPVAEFIGSPLSGTAPLGVTFTNQSTGTYSALLWNFGDGQTSASPNPAHVYAAAGTYTVTLTLTWAGGTVVRTRTAYVTASSVSVATGFSLAGPTSGTTGSPATFTVTPIGGPLSAAATVNLSAPGATLSTASLSFASGATAGQTFTVTRAADGTTSVSITNTLGLTNGTAISFASSALSPAPQPGTVTTIGTVTLYDYLGTVRAALAEGLSAADTRMQPRTGALAYCGATIWRDKYALPVLGGHGDSYDDGGYALDLATGNWETLIPPSTAGTSSAAADALGEYPLGTPGRPASQHTYAHLVTVGDDMIQVNGSAISSPATGSKQAHRWNGTPGSWQRYGTNTGGISPNGGAFCHYDATRNRLVRISLYSSSGAIDTMPADNPAADWTAHYINSGNRTAPHDIGCAMGYHAALDCYVLISPGEFTPRNLVYVMDPDNFAAGWVAVTVSGEVPPALSSPGLEYCPPMQAMATVDHTVNNKLFYVKPTGTRTDPWVWSSEVFTGSAIQGWDAGAAFNGVYRRFVWSEYLRGFVVCKRAVVLPELYVPTEVAAYYDWQDRAAAALAAGVAAGRGAVAYDFSEQPANGGDWKWGSLSASPKVTCEVPVGSRIYDTPQAGSPDHARDLVVYPPGSRGSLRMRVPQGVANAGDQWRFGVDDYAEQFRSGDEFWVCWRTRMNATYATYRFKATDDSVTWNGSYTEYKHSFWGYGMQTPYGVQGSPGTYYGYSSGASQSDNVMASCDTDVQGEIVMRAVTDQMTPGGPAGWMKYPSMYIGKFFDETVSKGRNGSYYTYQNGGVETSGAIKACEFIDPGGGAGNQYTDYSTCFIFPTDEWFSLMTHVILGPLGTAETMGTGVSRTGYTNSTVEYYGAYQGQPWTLLHRRTGVVIPSDSSNPGGQGIGRFGMFGWTTFMTGKWGGESHPDAVVWVSQIILQPGATMPAAPI